MTDSIHFFDLHKMGNVNMSHGGQFFDPFAKLMYAYKP
jgi:hypothetical protein